MDERSNVDYLSLFPTSSSEEILYINTKYFLQDKFFIDFDSIIEDTHRSLSIEDNINCYFLSLLNIHMLPAG